VRLSAAKEVPRTSMLMKEEPLEAFFLAWPERQPVLPQGLQLGVR
jgi:hypothetical protein